MLLIFNKPAVYPLSNFATIALAKFYSDEQIVPIKLIAKPQTGPRCSMETYLSVSRQQENN